MIDDLDFDVVWFRGHLGDATQDFDDPGDTHGGAEQASMPGFRGIRTATKGLIAAPWTPLASLCCRRCKDMSH